MTKKQAKEMLAILADKRKAQKMRNNFSRRYPGVSDETLNQLVATKTMLNALHVCSQNKRRIAKGAAK